MGHFTSRKEREFVTWLKTGVSKSSKTTTLHKTRLLDIMGDLIFALGRSDRGDKPDVEKGFFLKEISPFKIGKKYLRWF